MASSSSSASTPTQQRTTLVADQASTSQPDETVPKNEVVMTSTVRLARNSERKKMVNQYEFMHRLGRGQHGEVFVAIDTVQKKQVAIKAVKRKLKGDRMKELRKRNLPTSPHLPLTDKLGTTEQKIKKEIAIMKKCNHPHVVRLLEVIDDELNEKIYMVMEYLGGGEIKWRTEQGEPILRVSQTRRICRDVILGLEYLHHNGIIHRDIKPANLLWSDDRRMVKIADFGVSHFSYAQRLAAAGNGVLPEQEELFMNDSDLFKFAGTPMFLAPEILYDSGAETSQSSSTSSNLHALGTSTIAGGAATPRKKPDITKAIDIWALGVTLYALLFGRLPFSGDQVWVIYKKIKEDDWDVRETMGLDHIPVGGRHQQKPKKGEETDGYLAVDLFQKFLEKDPKKRITLNGLKRHPWLTKDMPHPEQWIRQTAISKSSLDATEDETSLALSAVKFRWPRSIAKGLYTLIRNVRPQRSFRRPPQPIVDVALSHKIEDASNRADTRSIPHLDLTRQRSIAIGVHERERAQQNSKTRPPRNKSSVDIRTQNGTWRSSSASSYHSDALPPSPLPHVDGSGSKPRRGSAPSANEKLETLQIPDSHHVSSSSRISSPQPLSAATESICPTPVHSITSRSTSVEGPSSASHERPRSRLSAWTRWLKAGSTYGTTSGEASSSTLPSGSTSPLSPTTPPGMESDRRFIDMEQPVRDLTARRSEDAFQQTRNRTANAAFSIAMRAASWGEVGDYGRPSDDRMSIYSGERAEEQLDADILLVGAGGVAQSPVPSVPSGILSTVSSTISLGPPVLSAAQAILQRVDGAESPTVTDPASQDPNALQRQGQYRSHATSPLAQSLYNDSREQLNRSSSTFEQYDNSSSSGSETPSDTEIPPSMSQVYQEEDEESESEESAPLEVRTRRPSWSLNDRPRSPSRRSDISREGCARPTIRI